MEKLIITVAVTGSVPTRQTNPHIPYSPEEIADEIVRACDVGASIAHVHVRDPQTGAPSFERNYFSEVLDRVRSRSDILLNFTTSGVNVPRGENFLERRISPVTLKPDICSLDIASKNFHTRVSYNPPEWGPYCAQKAREMGVKPEIEIFDSGHFAPAYRLIEERLLDPPYLFQICLGVSGGVPADLKSFLFMLERIPFPHVVWSAMGIGRAQFPIAVMSILQGGNVRVGFEDNVFLSKGAIAKSNAELVEKAVRIAREFGREIARPNDARKILGLN